MTVMADEAGAAPLLVSVIGRQVTMIPRGI